MTGKVILVGAGPGDPGLLTRRGEAVLTWADTVVYDRLVGPEILAMIPASARRFDVGKRPDHHPVPQQRINELLLEEAQQGRTVVRLKGGDPFLFGRGGEELSLLAEHGVPFEVVPGVTSALAAPTCAGIPVTHRDCASSLHIVTGHARAGKELEIPYAALTEAGGTCVFLMGMAALEDICSGLLAAGMAEDTPAAVVEQGTLPTQRKCISILAELPKRVRQAGLQNPAVIVVGTAAALSERFDWFSRRPLFGKKVVVTRPAGRGGRLSAGLRELGAQVLECPTIEPISTMNLEKMDRILHLLTAVQWIAFTSAFGVETFFDALWAAELDLRVLGNLRFAAIGPATARALEAYRLRADYIPQVYDTEHLAEGLAERAAGTVLLLRSAQGNPALPRILAERGVDVLDMDTYETRLRTDCPPELKTWLTEGEVVVTFTSGSTVRGFAEMLGPRADLSRVQGVSIGAQTAAVCEQYQISTIVAEQATEESLLERLMEQFGERSV